MTCQERYEENFARLVVAAAATAGVVVVVATAIVIAAGISAATSVAVSIAACVAVPVPACVAVPVPACVVVPVSVAPVVAVPVSVIPVSVIPVSVVPVPVAPVPVVPVSVVAVSVVAVSVVAVSYACSRIASASIPTRAAISAIPVVAASIITTATAEVYDKFRKTVFNGIAKVRAKGQNSNAYEHKHHGVLDSRHTALTRPFDAAPKTFDRLLHCACLEQLNSFSLRSRFVWGRPRYKSQAAQESVDGSHSGINWFRRAGGPGKQHPHESVIKPKNIVLIVLAGTRKVSIDTWWSWIGTKVGPEKARQT
jgi:hypothetical protein